MKIKLLVCLALLFVCVQSLPFFLVDMLKDLNRLTSKNYDDLRTNLINAFSSLARRPYRKQIVGVEMERPVNKRRRHVQFGPRGQAMDRKQKQRRYSPKDQSTLSPEEANKKREVAKIIKNMKEGKKYMTYANGKGVRIILPDEAEMSEEEYDTGENMDYSFKAAEPQSNTENGMKDDKKRLLVSSRSSSSNGSRKQAGEPIVTRTMNTTSANKSNEEESLKDLDVKNSHDLPDYIQNELRQGTRFRVYKSKGVDMVIRDNNNSKNKESEEKVDLQTVAPKFGDYNQQDNQEQEQEEGSADDSQIYGYNYYYDGENGPGIADYL